MLCLLLALIWLLFPLPVYAVTVDILHYPASISCESFLVTVQVESGSSGTNYLRVDLFQTGTKNYFGETDNGLYWYSGSSGLEYFPIELIKDTPLIATVSARLGEPTSAYYPGPGDYELRIRRYTSGGNQGSETPSSVPIAITYTPPTPTPTPTPSPSPSPDPSPDLSPSLPPSPVPSPSPISQSPSPSPDLSDQESTVAGVTIETLHLENPSPSLSIEPSSPTLNRARARTALFVGAGLLLISLAGYLGYRQYLTHKGCHKGSP